MKFLKKNILWQEKKKLNFVLKENFYGLKKIILLTFRKKILIYERKKILTLIEIHVLFDYKIMTYNKIRWLENFLEFSKWLQENINKFL